MKILYKSLLFVLISFLMAACSDSTGEETGTVTIRAGGGTQLNRSATRGYPPSSNPGTGGPLLADLTYKVFFSGTEKTGTTSINAGGGHEINFSLAVGTYDIRVESYDSNSTISPPELYATGKTTGVVVQANQTTSAPVQMKEAVTVTFDHNIPSAAVSTKLQAGQGDTIAEPSAPSRAGYTFGGWYKEAACTNLWVFSTDTVPVTTASLAPAPDFTLYAKWVSGLIIGTSSVTYTNITTNAITPIEVGGSPPTYSERTASFTVAVSGFTNNADANSVELAITPVTGLTFSGHNVTGPAVSGTKTFTVTVTYDGTQQFTSTSQTITITGLNNIGTYTYTGGNVTTSVIIYDGQAAGREIPVTQGNVQAFNSYASVSPGLGRQYKQTENITLTGSNNWTPIGDSTNNFTGRYDGNNKTITGLAINAASPAPGSFTEYYYGMFGYTSSSSQIRNVGLVNVNIDITSGNADAGLNIGGLVGRSGGTIESCYVSSGNVKGTVTPTTINLGGLVGYNGSTLQYCFAGCTVTAVSPSSPGNCGVGGLVGQNRSTIQYCYFAGNVNNTILSCSGGLVGWAGGGSIRNCYSTGSVGGGNFVGGVVGYTNGTNTIQYCYATGTVTSSAYYAGGVAVSGANTLTITDCVALNPSITAASYRGRVVGSVTTPSTMSGNYARSDMTAGGASFTLGAQQALNGIDGADAVIGTDTLSTVFGSFSTSVWSGITGATLNTGVVLPTLQGMPSPAQNPTLP